jgi:putative sigma-54 modulation protein
MNVHVTARHFQMTDDVREHAIHRVGKIEKFGHALMDAHVVLDVEKHRQIAEVSVIGKQLNVMASAESHDMIQSIDDACEKVQVQIKRHADKARDRRTMPEIAESSD